MDSLEVEVEVEVAVVRLIQLITKGDLVQVV